MSFSKIHLLLNKAEFKPAGTGRILEEHCDYNRFKDLMTRVGKPSNWNLREEYQVPIKEQSLKEIFNSRSCRLWVFMHDGHEVGFCQVAPVEDLQRLFKNTNGIVEMYKMGVFPEYTGKGLARGCVSSVLTELFKDYATVYLNTRDTNVVNSIPFWKKFGFEVFKTEVKPDDFIL